MIIREMKQDDLQDVAKLKVTMGRCSKPFSFIHRSR